MATAKIEIKIEGPVVPDSLHAIFPDGQRKEICISMLSKDDLNAVIEEWGYALLDRAKKIKSEPVE